MPATPRPRATGTADLGTAPVADPFGCEQRRAAVLAAWAADPARLREDTNAELDAVAAGTPARLLVELLQNAADAGRAAGAPARVRITLTDTHLLVANTGAPLTAEGVTGLATLRASAKVAGHASADGATGRFGTGFAAVLALTDAPEVVSAAGSVRFDRAATAALLQDPAAAAPALRLPFALDAAPPAGWTTEVRLPLREDGAAALAEQLLDRLDPALLLTLPGLAEVEVVRPGHPSRLLRWTARPLPDVPGTERLELTDGPATSLWLRRGATVEVPAAELAELPPEDRGAAEHAAVAVLVPLTDDGAVAGLPALPLLVVGAFPVEPDRRRTRPGRVRDRLLARAAALVAELAAGLDDPFPVIPSGLPGSALDAELREALLPALAGERLLPTAAGDRVRPGDALVPDLGPAADAAVELLADEVSGLLGPRWAAPARAAAAVGLGARRLDTAGLVDLLGGLDRPPEFWRRVYAGLAGTRGRVPDTDALAGLPVPLADGRRVTGARGALLPARGVDAAAFGRAGIGLRLVHPDAADEALLTLGARSATPEQLLAEPAVADAVTTAAERWEDGEDPAPGEAEALADAVLGLLAATAPAVPVPGWLPRLLLPADDGGLRPAGELLVGGSPLADVVDREAGFGVLDPALLDRWGLDVLVRAGALAAIPVLRLAEVPLDPEPDAPELDALDGYPEWVDAVLDELAAAGDRGGPPLAEELLALGDLDLVADWPAALRLLAGDPEARAAIERPTVVRLPDGGRREVEPYARWWLRTHPVVAGHAPGELLLPDGDRLLAGLFEPVPAGVPVDLLAQLGARRELADVLADPSAAWDLLDRLGDAERTVDRQQVRRLHAALAPVLAADATAGDEPPAPPLAVRAVAGDQLVVAPPERCVVVDRPDLLPLVDRPVLPVPLRWARDLASVTGAPLAGQLHAFPVVSEGREQRVELPLLGPVTVVRHERLLVDTPQGPRETGWRAVGGRVHAGPGTRDLARAAAWAAGAWGLRHAVAAALEDAAARLLVAAEEDLAD
jgi:hypothetical protein